MSDTTLSFNVLARDNASSTITRIGQKFGALHLGVGKVTKGLAAVGPALAGLAVGAGLTQFVNDARESAKVGRLTTQVIKSTGGAARISADQVGNLATAISNKTGADDEAIQSGQNLLLTFTNIKNGVGKGNDIFNQASQAITDMTAAMNGGEVTAEGMKTSSIQLGKALNDPIKGVTALQKVGVSFTQKQKDQIKTLVDSGKTMEAQKIILKELGKEFGGAAEAAADPLTKLKTIAGNASEAIGGLLLPIVDRAATFLGKIIPPAVETATLGFKALAAAFSGEGVTSNGFIGVMERIGVTARRITDGLKSSVIPGLMTFGKDLFTTASKWTGMIIGGLKSGIESGDWKPLGKALGNGLAAGFKGIGDSISKVGDAIGDLIDRVDWGKLGSNISNAIRAMLTSVDWKSIGSAVGNAIINLFQKATDLGQKIGAAFKALMDRIDWKQIGHDSTTAIGRFTEGVDWGRLAKTLGLAVLKSLKIEKGVYDSVIHSAGLLVEGMAIEIGKAIGRWFSSAGKWLWKAGGDLMSGLKSGAADKMKGIGPWLKSTIVDPVVNSVKAFFGVRSPSTVFASIGRQLIDGLRAGIAGAVRGIGNWMSRTVVAPVLAGFARAGTWLVAGGRNAVAGFKNGIAVIGRTVGGFVYANVIQPTVRGFMTAGTWLNNAGRNVVAGFKNGISAIGRGIGSFVYSNVIQPAVRPFLSSGKWLVQAGKNVIAGFGAGMRAVWASVTKWVAGIAQWIKDHKGPVSLDGRLLIPAGKAIMSGFLSGLQSGAGRAWDFVSRVGGKTKEAVASAYGWIKGIGWPDALGSSKATLSGFGGGVARWAKIALKALQITHSPASWLGSLLRRMNQESGGNPKAINLWDSNAKRGTPSMGLMQTILPTFNAYAGAYRKLGPWDPLANIIASINYANARYGSAPRGWDRPGGYKHGGWLMPGELAYNETRKPEPILNQSQWNALAGGGQTVVLRIESGGSRVDDFIVELLRRYVRTNGGNVQTVLGRG